VSYAEWRAFFAANPDAASEPLWTMATADQRNAAVTARTGRVYRAQMRSRAEGNSEWITPISLSRVTALTNPYLDMEPTEE
jgi:hypothetical protein